MIATLRNCAFVKKVLINFDKNSETFEYYYYYYLLDERINFLFYCKNNHNNNNYEVGLLFVPVYILSTPNNNKFAPKKDKYNPKGVW